MVSSDSIRTVVGSIGNATSLALFLSPLPTFVRIWKRGSVEQFSPLPYLATLLNCMMWVVYGLPMVHPHSTLIISINGAGTLIELAFVFLFLVYSQGPKRLKVFAIFLVELVIVAVVLALILTLAHTHERRSMVVGILCVCFGSMMYASPLSVMKMVITTKSVEYMPLSISLTSMLNGLCWTIYALIRFDIYVTIPNGLGLLFAVVQLVLYGVYYKSTKRQMEERKKAEAGMTEVVVTDGPATS